MYGEGGIRTLGNCKVTSVFKTDAFDHSATSPSVIRLTEKKSLISKKNRFEKLRQLEKIQNFT